jgi:hypothetical protein
MYSYCTEGENYQVKIRLAFREVTSCTLVNSYQIIRCYIRDKRDSHGHRRVNLEAREKGMVRTTNHSSVSFPLFPQKL